MLFLSVLQSIIMMLLNCSFFSKRLQNVTSFLFCHLFPQVFSSVTYFHTVFSSVIYFHTEEKIGGWKT